jgi:outer membrane protein OmpA-like peptidoglycan-associated protein
MTHPRAVRVPLLVQLLLPLVLVGAVRGTAAAQVDQSRSFSPQLFHAAPGPDEFVTVEPAAPLAHLQWALGLYLNYARNALELAGYDAMTLQPTGSHSELIGHAIGADVWAALGLWNRFQIALALPMTLYQTGSDFDEPTSSLRSAHVAAPNGFAFGDPRIHLKARLFGREHGPQLALSHWLSIPLGDDSNFGGEPHFSGFAGEARVLLGWEASRWRFGAFFGFHWRANPTAFFSTVQGQQLTYGGAFAFDAVPGRFSLLAEIYGHSNSVDSISTQGVVFSDAFDNPLEVDVAGKITLVPDVKLTVGAGYLILNGIGAPQPRAFLGLVYAPEFRDRDGDGVPDSRDLCPDRPEDKDGFKDSDGCPDPDNDGDTILDKDDKCPNAPEDFDEFEDSDGCPDPDNDKDGIPDIQDACPMDPEDHLGPKPNDGCPMSKTDTDGDGITDDKDKCPKDPEDKDGFEDEDGCPDPDNDNDGIPDAFDQCPNAAEDTDGFEDEDGCPDPDNDKDGVPDKLDKCPNQPETINGYQDEDGCPDSGPPPKAKIERGQIVILDKIFFDTDKATIKPVSFALLDQVAQIIRGHMEFKIRIEGHTDAQGNQDHNIQLSKERADSVRTYLIKKGIDPERLISAGYGPAMPIADNKTKAGREANRRVEFHIVEEPSKKKEPAKEPATEDGSDPGAEKQ